ncbi:mechanosensitive ion channel protein MscS [archaeon SCG-AAA382B04]|nr:mechanosensitive ion channel protein MscS [archaeon SCG-AAA382B04]
MVKGKKLIEEIITQLTQKIIEYSPRLLSLIIFLTIAYISLKIFNHLLNNYLAKKYQQKGVTKILLLISKIFIYYAIILTSIAILGLNELAASLGTAIGFLALGVSIAMRGIISDMISGFYLLKDPDIEQGDKIETEKGNGTVKEIGLRKTKLTTKENNTLVIANSDVEKKWTKLKEE